MTPLEFTQMIAAKERHITKLDAVDEHLLMVDAAREI